ncbi:MAG: hypothetical protein ACK5D5_02975 [Bacteroidota bacterium]|jgi:hypothetical protein
MKLRIQFILFLSLGIAYCYSQDNFAVIGNDISANQISIAETKAILKGKNTFWKNGKKVILVLPSSKHPGSNDFSKLYYNTNSDGVKRYWLSLVFQGRSSSPVFLDTDREIIEYITKNEGAVGVIDKDNLKSVEDKFKINIIK